MGLHPLRTHRRRYGILKHRIWVMTMSFLTVPVGSISTLRHAHLHNQRNSQCGAGFVNLHLCSTAMKLSFVSLRRSSSGGNKNELEAQQRAARVPLGSASLSRPPSSPGAPVRAANLFWQVTLLAPDPTLTSYLPLTHLWWELAHEKKGNVLRAVFFKHF